MSYKKLKIVVIGDGAVGKTSLLVRYTQKIFDNSYVPTVVDTSSQIAYYNGEVVMLSLYDTAGQEDYEKLRKFAYAHTNVFLLCYSVEDRLSFEHIPKWVSEIKADKIGGKSPMIILVGLKVDLRDKSESEHVNNSEGFEIMKKIKAKAFMECSSKTNVNVDELFQTAIDLFYNKKERRKQKCKFC